MPVMQCWTMSRIALSAVAQGEAISKLEVLGSVRDDCSGSSVQVQVRSVHAIETNPSPGVCWPWVAIHSAFAEQELCCSSGKRTPLGNRTLWVRRLPSPAWSTHGDEIDRAGPTPASRATSLGSTRGSGRTSAARSVEASRGACATAMPVAVGKGGGDGPVAATWSRLAHASRQTTAAATIEVAWRAALFPVCEEATATLGWIRRAMSRTARPIPSMRVTSCGRMGRRGLAI